MTGHPPYNLYLLRLWVTRRPSDHPLTLPLSLRITLKPLHSNGSIHQSTKGLIAPYIQLLLQDARETVIETVHLILISIHMSPSILCNVVKLVHIFYHSHASLLQLQKLRQLPVHQISKNIVLMESSRKLLPSHMVVHRLHGVESVPPSTGRS